jgi:hypothetical protein
MMSRHGRGWKDSKRSASRLQLSGLDKLDRSGALWCASLTLYQPSHPSKVRPAAAFERPECRAGSSLLSLGGGAGSRSSSSKSGFVLTP